MKATPFHVCIPMVFCKPTMKFSYTFVFIGRLSKLKNRYVLETDVFFISNGRNTEKILNKTANGVCIYHFNIGKDYLNFITTGILPTKKHFLKKPTQMHKNLYPERFFVYHMFSKDWFHKNTGNKNPIAVDEDPSFNQSSISSPPAFDFSKKIMFSSTEGSK